MLKLLKRIRIAIFYGDELEELITQERIKKQLRRVEENRHRLKLCYKHRQEQNMSHYAEHNCDYCKLLSSKGNHQ